jgi:enoyl-CoA hydratase/carnithine racemase
MLHHLEQDFQHLDLERQGGWLTVWFNEPERRNPLTSQRVTEILRLADWLDNAPEIRGVAFRGRGGVFCAGGDLKAFLSMAGDSGRTLARSSEAVAQMLDRIRALPQFTVAIVEGAAVAGGLGLLCACDRVITLPDAKFSLSEVRIGLVAAQIAPFVLDRVGPVGTRSMMLLGDWCDGQAAVAAGLADTMCSSEMLEAEITSLRARLAKVSPMALAATKSLLRELPGLDRTGQIALATEVFVAAAHSEDGREGLASFAEKRPAGWTEKPS